MPGLRIIPSLSANAPWDAVSWTYRQTYRGARGLAFQLLPYLATLLATPAAAGSEWSADTGLGIITTTQEKGRFGCADGTIVERRWTNGLHAQHEVAGQALAGNALATAQLGGDRPKFYDGVVDARFGQRRGQHAGALNLSTRQTREIRWTCNATTDERLARQRALKDEEAVTGAFVKTHGAGASYTYGPRTDQFGLALNLSQSRGNDTLKTAAATATYRKAMSEASEIHGGLVSGNESYATRHTSFSRAEGGLSHRLAPRWVTGFDLSGEARERQERIVIVSGTSGVQLTQRLKLGVKGSSQRYFNSRRPSAKQGTIGLSYAEGFNQVDFSADRVAYDDAANSEGTLYTLQFLRDLSVRSHLTLKLSEGTDQPDFIRNARGCYASYRFELKGRDRPFAANPKGRAEVVLSYALVRIEDLTRLVSNVRRSELQANLSF